MIFADKDLLFLLVLLPVLAFLFWKFYEKRKSDLSKIVSKDNLSLLISADITIWIKVYALLLLGFFFLILTLARPQWGDKQEEIEQESSQIVIALDVSKSMLAKDISPNRLERAKFMLLNIIEENAGNKMGVIVFSGTAMWQCPMTYDLEALKMFLQDVSVEQLPVGGTQVSDAIILAATSVKEAFGDNKVLVLISDGEDHDSKISQAIKSANDIGLKIIAVGIGTQEGSPITQPGTNSYIKDQQGRTVISKLNPTLLKEIADKTGGRYLQAQGADISGALINALEGVGKSKTGTFQKNKRVDRFQIFLLLAIAAFLASMLIAKSNKKK